ncbi:AlpA family transcriptional regulator [Sphingosinicella sp. CPCC 101087]|uniref:helix-turn-helix transcriptional regulator n=1 Tax=Sphingosinicella sp. CPCC 101087 TaxID=2497754 RepID=UPI00101CD02E|nr:AlpA family phage regulatory protein [Sphingosinicella sp. CPCC 101087]
MSDRLLRRPEVERELGLKRSAIYEMMQLPPEDPRHLPRPKRIGRRAVAWPASWIEAWKDRQPTAERHA